MIHAKTVHHLGIAVHSIAEQRPFYEDILGAVFEGIEEVAEQKVRVGFFRLGPADGGVRIELLEPTSPDSPIARHLEKRGPGLHHVAYEVSDLRGRLAAIRQAGLRLIDEQPRRGAHHMQIAFLHPQATHGVLTELCEPQK